MILSRFRSMSTSIHIFVDIPCTTMSPLPTWHSFPSPRCPYLLHGSLQTNRYATLTGPLEYQQRPWAHLIPQPRSKALLLATWSSFKIASEYSLPSMSGEDTDSCPSSSQNQAHGLWSVVSLQPSVLSLSFTWSPQQLVFSIQIAPTAVAGG